MMGVMKSNFGFLLSIAALGLSACSRAQMFSLTFTPFSGYSDSAELTLYTTQIAPGEYQVNSAVGMADWMMVMGTINTNGYGMDDNILTWPGTPSLDSHGLGFTDMMGMEYSIFTDPTIYGDPYEMINNMSNPNGIPLSQNGPGSLGTVTIAAVPEPAPMASLGVGVLGLVGLRRRRTR
jgi:hypothetical protein